MSKRDVRTIALRFYMDNDLEKLCYERLLDLEGGTFHSLSTYVRTLVMRQLFEKDEKYNIDMDKLADKIAVRVIDKISQEDFSKNEDIPDYVNI